MSPPFFPSALTNFFLGLFNVDVMLQKQTHEKKNGRQNFRQHHEVYKKKKDNQFKVNRWLSFNKTTVLFISFAIEYIDRLRFLCLFYFASAELSLFVFAKKNPRKFYFILFLCCVLSGSSSLKNVNQQK